MNFNWAQLLDLANELHQQASTERGQKREALLRAAASRAYYAAFNVAAQWLRRNHSGHRLPQTGEAHQAVADFFIFHQDAPYKEIGARLVDMRATRNLVDYRTRVDELGKLTRLNLFDANRVLNALAGLEG